MEAYLRALIAILPPFLRGPAGGIVDRLLAIWRWSESLARRVRGGWQRVLSGAARLRAGIERLAGQAYTTLRWLTLVRVPQLAGLAREAAIRWAAARVAAILADLAALRGFAIGLVAKAESRVRALLDSWVAFLRQQLAGLLADLRRVIGHVFGVLGTPERIVDWLFAALLARVTRWVIGNADRLAGMVWRQRTRIALSTVEWVERFIARML